MEVMLLLALVCLLIRTLKLRMEFGCLIFRRAHNVAKGTADFGGDPDQHLKQGFFVTEIRHKKFQHLWSFFSSALSKDFLLFYFLCFHSCLPAWLVRWYVVGWLAGLGKKLLHEFQQNFLGRWGMSQGRTLAVGVVLLPYQLIGWLVG